MPYPLWITRFTARKLPPMPDCMTAALATIGRICAAIEVEPSGTAFDMVRLKIDSWIAGFPPATEPDRALIVA
jgi:hypothetical protein